MTEYELNQELPTPQKQQDFYEKLREKITTYLNSKTGKANKFAPYLLFVPDMFHLLTKALLDDRIDGKSKAIIGSGLLYFIAPFDFMPEGIIAPAVKRAMWAVATFIINMLLNKFSPDILEEHWAGDHKLLDALKKISETSDGLLGKLPARSLLSRFLKSTK